MRRRTASVLSLSLLLAALSGSLGALCDPNRPVGPVAGLLDYQAPGWVAVPGAHVNVLGGNLVVSRRHLDLDTRVAPLEVGATWNATAGAWRWSFELHYDGVRFVDGSGAFRRVDAVAPGAAIPGSAWVRRDARTLVTKGGLVHRFDADGALSAVHWRSAAYPRLVYRKALVAGAPRIVEVVQWRDASRSEPLLSLTYDGEGRLRAAEDRAGRRLEYRWSAAGLLVEARGPRQVQEGSVGERYRYDGRRLLEIESPEGEAVAFAYDGARVTRVVALGGERPTWTFTYRRAADGRSESEVVAPDGARATYRYDGQRRLWTHVSAQGDRTSFTWNGLRPASLTTAAGVTTRWIFEDDDVVQTLEPSGNVVTVRYAGEGESRDAPLRRPVRDVTDLLGTREARAYDAVGRLAWVENGAGERWELAWGSDGGAAELQAPSGLRTRYLDRGRHGQPRRIETAGVVLEQSYDAVGNPRGAPGPGGIVARAFDADRRLASLELAGLDVAVPEGSATLSLERRSDGRLRAVRRPGGGDVELGYDALGRLSERRERVDGAWQVTRFESDALGRTTAVARPNGMRVEYAYDGSGRVREIGVLREGREESRASLVHEDGRLVARVDSAHAGAREDLLYDPAGRVRAVVHPGGEALLLAYDLRGRIVEERYREADGRDLLRLTFAYDAADREVEVRQDGALLLARRYEGGRLVELRYGNGLVRRFRYDAADGVLAEAETTDAAGRVVEHTHLERELSSGLPVLTWHVRTTTAGASAHTTHEHFVLAPPGSEGPGARVGQWSHRADGSAPVGYGHDVLGNRTRADDGASPLRFVYNAEGNRLLRVREEGGPVLHSYAFDSAGFVTRRDGEAVAWDGAGRPVAVGSRALWRWDSFGRLLASLRDGEVRAYAFGGRVARGFAGQATLDLGLVRLDLASGEHRYRLHDFRGNAKVTTDAAGAVVGHARYAPWGASLVEGEPDPDASFAFAAAAGDVLRMGHRLYDPVAGRFLAPDPVAQLVNDYAYTLGNPVWYWDPTGASAQTALGVAFGIAVGTMAVGAVIGGAVGLGVTVAAAGVAVGILVPPTAVAVVASVGLAKFLGATPGGLALSGFALGQALQPAVAADFAGADLTTRPNPQPATPSPRPPDPPPGGDTSSGGQLRTITIRGADEAPPPQGCSPVVVAGQAPRLPRLRTLAGLGILHAALAVAWRLRTRRTRRCPA